MPATLRTPLGLITLNRIRKKQLSLYTKGKIIGARLFSVKPADIVRIFEIPDQTVHDTINNAISRPYRTPLQKPGRPVLYTDRDERLILRFVRTHRKTKYTVIKYEYGLTISYSSIKRILRKNRILTWRVKKRPELTDILASKRLAWAKVRENWTVEDFQNHMWSNECSAERGKGKEQE